MHTLATYVLSHDFADECTASAFFDKVSTEVDAWLKSKGAVVMGKEGDFQSKNPNGSGSITKEITKSQSGAYINVCLEELSGESEIFSTVIYTAIGGNCVSLYCALQVEGLESGVTRVRSVPKCPAIVRRVATLSADWVINGNEIPSGLVEAKDEIAGALLAAKILSPGRRVPILAVAKTESDVELWPGTASDLAYELFGVAKVVLVSDAASCALSEQEAERSSIDCYDGAMRLYWPMSDGLVPSQLWTQRQLVSRDKDGRGKNRVVRDVKELLMSAAAISNPLPPLIGRIRAEARAREIADLEKSSSQAAALEARLAALQSENKELLRRTIEAEQQVFELSTKLKYQTTYHAPPGPDDREGSNDPVYSAPQPGETRFYKKIADKGSHDLLRAYKDCGHSSWQNSAGADKARKGVEKLEGRSDWKNMLHCGSCTGGGAWKVRW